MPAHLDPELSLNRHWEACIFFTSDSQHQTLVEVADRLSQEFSAVITERYGGEQSWAKEYWWLDIEGKKLLMIRKNGLSLGVCDRQDNEIIIRIARAFAARNRGWRLRTWLWWNQLIKKWTPG